MIVPTDTSGDQPSRHSLWRELSDGTVSVWLRVLVNVALGAFLTGAAFLLTFFAALLVPAFRYNWGWGSSPREEVAVGVFVTCGLAFLAGSIWIWSRKSRQRALLKPAVWTISIGAVTTVLCVIATDSFRGLGVLMAFGLVLVASAAVMLIWTEAWFHVSRGRPMRNEQDGLPDVRCPSCGYRMVGLHEARCPECGRAYTLDELLAGQDFSRTPPPPVAPAAARRSEHAA